MFQAKGGSSIVTGTPGPGVPNQNKWTISSTSDTNKAQPNRPEGRHTIDYELVPSQLTSRVKTDGEDVLNCTVFSLETGGTVSSSISPDQSTDLVWRLH